MGLPAVDLLTEEEWIIAKRDFGLACSTGFPAVRSIPDGINNTKFHDGIVASLTEMIPKAAKAGIPNVITFFGNRRGQDIEEAKVNSVAGLNRIKPVAEAEGVTVIVELLNSKVNHKDYHGDNTPYGVEVCKRVGSPRVKLLYDIYHMQIMEGDVIRTMGDNWDYIAHLHTGGVPGRNELDDTQELQWKTIAKWVADKATRATSRTSSCRSATRSRHCARPCNSVRSEIGRLHSATAATSLRGVAAGSIRAQASASCLSADLSRPHIFEGSSSMSRS